jgi:phosphatidylserine/phosphatidylglycerophosphate/cardiolipin synthase-like enzyme
MKRSFILRFWVCCYLLSSLATSAAAEPVEARFTGESNLADRLIESIDQAEDHIKIMVFIFEYELISGALIRAVRRGVDVEVITDIRSTMIKSVPTGGDCA